jgi:SAM-dependent methyltransferase
MAEQPREAAHWNAYSARWKLVGQPLRPGPSDIAYLRSSVARLWSPRATLQGLEREPALLLGVTPEIANIDWQPPLELLAVDKSEGMVRAVWPGDTSTRRAEVGDWLELQAPSGGFSLVVGDGVFSIFDYPAGYEHLAQALGRLTRPGGLLSLRLFCRPERCERVEEVFDALAAGSIGNFHIFKWRLAMALQGDATRGVRLADIWDSFRAHVPSIAELARHRAWPEPEARTIESYRDVEDRYSFSTQAEVVSALASSFELLETWQPDYELGERCPHLTFRRYV